MSFLTLGQGAVYGQERKFRMIMATVCSSATAAAGGQWSLNSRIVDSSVRCPKSPDHPFDPNQSFGFPDSGHSLCTQLPPRIPAKRADLFQAALCTIANWFSQLHSQRADAAQGEGPETGLQVPPLACFAPTHHALHSNVSGCPRSFVCEWITPAPGLDSINIRAFWQASPKNRPLGLPSCVTPI